MTKDELPATYRAFVAAHPEVAKAYQALGTAVRNAGPLSEREVALVKLALSVGARLEGAAHSHVRKALAAGVEPEALRQIPALAIPTLGFPSSVAAHTWIDEELERAKK